MTDVASEIVDVTETGAGRPGQGWRVDRTISLGVILVLLANAGGGIWFAAKLDARVGRVEEWMRDNAGVEHRLTQIETTLQLMLDRKEAAR